LVDKVDVVIVGAGPSGCKTGEIIAKKGYKVLILEEHSKIGVPTQCTGLVSQRIGRIPKEIILNKVKKARFCSKDKYFEVKSKKSVYVIDRKKYDVFRAKKAREAGAKITLSTRFLNFKNGKVFSRKINFQTKLLVGADGPNSTVAKISRIKLPENLLKAIQVRAKSNFNSDIVELWFGSNIAPNLFAWVVPENENIARVGLMTNKNPNKYFEKFLKERIGDAKTRDKIGGIGRYGLIKKSIAENVLLVGDAACQIKPFSMGGIVYGQIGAEYAGKGCIRALEANDFSEKFLKKNYDKQWKKELAGPIRKGLLMKKIFSNVLTKSFSFELIEKLRITEISSFLDMDFLGTK